MKGKVSSQFVCSSCGYESVQWFGKCPGCGTWNTMVEFRESKEGKRKRDLGEMGGLRESKPIKLSEIKGSVLERVSSGIGELDRVLGGGFVAGEAVLLAGEPGVGKSTLLLQLSGATSSKFKVQSSKLLYVSGEESPEQIKMRAGRLGVKGENLLLLAETNVERVIEEVSRVSQVSPVSREEETEKVARDTRDTRDTLDIRSTLLIVDSIQTLWSEEIEGSPGSISQVRGCSQRLIELAKKTGVIVVLIGQINKEGEIAGPMMLSHMVDCVLFLEGERFTELRLLRGFKNRFGPTDEVGVFRMTEKGMEQVSNPSEIFLGEVGNLGEVGEVITCTMEGTRPILVEIQALVTKSYLAMPRRVANGIDYNRLVTLTAVLQKTLNLPLWDQDIYLNVSGGFKISEPAADLAVCLAIISSFRNKPLPFRVCAFGEVGLLGEIRKVNGEEKRIKEAKKLGFDKILSSGTVKNLREAIKAIV